MPDTVNLEANNQALVTGKWFDIVRVGKYPGLEVTTAMLEQIASGYDPEYETAVLNFDHERGGKAHGKITALRVQGDKLQGQASELSTEMDDGIRSGAWFRQSAEIYPKHPKIGVPYLRGLAILGNKTPEVRGLDRIALEDSTGDYVTLAIDEREETMPEKAPTKPSRKADREDKNTPEVDLVKLEAVNKENEDLRRQVAELEDQNNGKAAVVAQLESKVQNLESYVEDAKRQAHTARIGSALDSLKARGKMTPADAAYWTPVLLAAGVDQVVNFAADQGGDKSLVDAILGWFEDRQPVKQFGAQTRAAQVFEDVNDDELANRARELTQAALADGKITQLNARHYYDEKFQALRREVQGEAN